MIQPAAPTIASATATPAGQTASLPAGNGGEGAETSGFASVLASLPKTAAGTAAGAGAGAAIPPGQAPAHPDLGAALPATTAAAPEASATGTFVAATLPPAGKILPLAALPLSATPIMAADGQGVPEPTAADGAVPAAQAIPTLLAAMRAIRLPAETASAETATPAKGTARPAGDSSTDSETHADAARLLLMPGMAPAPNAHTALPDAPATAASAPSADRPAALPTGLPPMIEAQLLGRPLTLRQTGAEAATAASDPAAGGTAPAQDDALALKLDPARITAPTPGPMAFDAAAARPVAAVRLRPVIAQEITEPGKAAPSAIDTAALLNAPAASITPGIPASSVPGAAGAPQMAPTHDFAALMDRLIAARDAAQTGVPQSVHMSFNHAEFGPVSMDFRHDRGGLAVSVASTDPDFARAVQAAIPAPSAAAGADATSRDGSQAGQGNTGQGNTGQARGEMAAGGGNASGRQSRSQSGLPTDAAPAAASRSSAEPNADATRRRGIFA